MKNYSDVFLVKYNNEDLEFKINVLFFYVVCLFFFVFFLEV